MRDKAENGGTDGAGRPVSTNNLGGAGAVNSVVVDRQAGLVFEGSNGKRNSFLPLESEKVNPGLREYMRELEAQGPWPHNDTPMRHAEIKAFNSLLEARGVTDADGVRQALNEVAVDNRFFLKDGPDFYSPCCANCYRTFGGGPEASPEGGKGAPQKGGRGCGLVLISFSLTTMSLLISTVFPSRASPTKPIRLAKS
jgi:hypothetical protein